MPSLRYPHVELRDGVPYVHGTQTKVVEIVMDHLAFHWDAYELHRQHSHLTLGQIHSALGYYYDNQNEMDGMIAERIQQEDDILTSVGPSPIRAKLLAAKAARLRS